MADLWRCPVHGVLEPHRWASNWPADTGYAVQLEEAGITHPCPVLGSDEEECCAQMVQVADLGLAGEPAKFLVRSDALLAARNVARHHGYAIAVHGSEVRDLDLIAVPWVEDTGSTPGELIESIAVAVDGEADADPTQKPHGRLGWAIHPRNRIGLDNWYLDISVMPPETEPDASEQSPSRWDAFSYPEKKALAQALGMEPSGKYPAVEPLADELDAVLRTEEPGCSCPRFPLRHRTDCPQALLEAEAQKREHGRG